MRDSERLQRYEAELLDQQKEEAAAKANTDLVIAAANVILKAIREYDAPLTHDQILRYSHMPSQ